MKERLFAVENEGEAWACNFREITRALSTQGKETSF